MTTQNYWDFYSGRLQNAGPSSVFVVTSPEYTVGEMMATKLRDPHGFQAVTGFTAWHNSAIQREEDIGNTIFMVRDRLDFEGLQRRKGRDAARFRLPDFINKIYSEKTIGAIVAIQEIQKIWSTNQFTAQPYHTVFEPQMIYAATHLQLLCKFAHPSSFRPTIDT